MTPPATTSSVLVVCTANICRSPAAEAHLRAALGPASGITVASAGLHARVGAPVAPEMAAFLDVPLDGFTARQLTPELVRSADLVLTMTRDQRRAVVTTVPAAVRRTFTLLELAELAVLARELLPTGPDATAALRLSALVATAPRVRTRRVAGRDDEIADPYGRTADDHARAMAAIRAAAADVAGSLLPPQLGEP